MTHRRMVLTVVAGLALAGVCVMLLATPHGVGVLPDSTVYFDAARNLANGRGLVVISGTTSESIPLVHYPPLYSSLLALALKGGVTVETAARWLNASLFGANIFLVGYAIAFSVCRSFWFPVLGALLTLTAPDMLAIHSVAMTEPLYLALTLGGLLLLARYLQNGRRYLLLMAAILIALSCLTRYVGLATIASASIGIVLLERTENAGVGFAFSFKSESLRRRILDAVIFATFCGVPVVIWSIRNRLAGGTPDRHLAFHPVTFQQIVPAISTVAQWLLLGKVSPSVRVIVFLIEAVVLMRLAWCLWSEGSGESENPAVQLTSVLRLFIFVYVAFLIFTASFIDADTVFDSRSLLPVHVVGIVLFVCWTQDLYCRGSYHNTSARRFAGIALIVFAVLLVASHSFRFVTWLERTTKDGQGYASRTWTESETIMAVRRTPPNVPIYSNAYDAIHYLTGRSAVLIPEKIIHGTGQPNPNYQQELDAMVKDISDHEGMLVYFHRLTERSYLPSEAELRERIPRQVLALNDGSILKP